MYYKQANQLNPSLLTQRRNRESGENKQGSLYPSSKTRLEMSGRFFFFSLYEFSSAAQSYLTFCNPMDGSMPGFPVHHQLLELAQTHVHQVNESIKLMMPLNHLIIFTL